MHRWLRLGRGGKRYALWLRVDRRGTVADRREVTRKGRRATDLQSFDNFCVETTQELSRLKTVVQILIDAVQGLTGSQKRPE